MISRTVLSAGLAAMCILAVGLSATTLESSLSTDPDDVIDLDWSKLPISEDRAKELKDELFSNSGDSDDGQREETSAGAVGEDRGGGGGGAENQRRAEPGASEDSQSRNPTQGRESVLERPGLLDRLLALLGRLLPVIALLGFVAALALLGYRYRDRLPSWRDRRDNAERRVGAADGGWPPGEPTTEVGRAWFAMVGRLDLDRPSAMTPAECATAAVDAGMDPEAVAEVTRVFEEVRYGGAPFVGERRERLREGLRRLDLDAEVATP